MDKPISAKELSELLNKACQNEGKDFTIYIGDRPLYRDEISFDILDKRVNINGMIYHEDVWKKTEQLKADIEKAFDRFF